MSKYIITTESTVDIAEEILIKRGIPYISYTFSLDGKEYNDDFGKSYPYDKFYNDIHNGATPSTSQINQFKYKEFFERFLKEGYSIIHISLSSGITSSFNSCSIAARELNEKYDCKVYPLDSLNAAAGQGILTLIAKDKLDEGLSYEENINYLEDIKLNINAWFFSSDLTSYIRGGRISKTSGFIGGALKICPVLNINNEGKLIVREKIRTSSKAIKTMVEKFKANINSMNYTDKIIINHSACEKEALELKELILSEFDSIKDIELYSVGTVIGSHTGPGTVGLFFIGNKRID